MLIYPEIQHKSSMSYKEHFENTKTFLSCKLCYGKIATALFLSCGHVVSCEECVKSLKKLQCPTCRCKIIGYVNIKSDLDILKIPFNE